MVNNSCVFCQICTGQSPADMLYQDDEIAIFNDIKPVAKHHYLAIPKEHIKNAKQIMPEHKELGNVLINF